MQNTSSATLSPLTTQIVTAPDDNLPVLPSNARGRRPSYGALSSVTDASGEEEVLLSKHEPQVLISRTALACLLLQHTSSSISTSLHQFATYIFTVEVYKNTLAPASLIGLVTFATALLFSGYVGGFVDITPRLKFVRTSVFLQKVAIIAAFGIFIVLFGPLEGLPAKVFHDDSTLNEKLKVYTSLGLTVVTAVFVWMVNIGINVAVEKDWVTTIAQGDPATLTRLNANMTSIDFICRIAGPMVVSFFTMFLDPTASLYGLAILVALCGILEYCWIQIVYTRFPILRDDELRSGRGQVRLADGDGDEEEEAEESGLRGEIRAWSEFIRMPVFFSASAQALTWLTTLHLDGIGVAHFKMSGGYSDMLLGSIRGMCMLSCLVGTTIMPSIERRTGTAKLGVFGLSWGMVCFLFAVTALFLEYPLRDHGTVRSQVLNAIVMFGAIIIARMGHINFDLAQVKSMQQALSAHPRRNRLMARQNSLQAFCAILKYLTTLVFSKEEQYKWTALITLLANVVAMLSYLNHLRLSRETR